MAVFTAIATAFTAVTGWFAGLGIIAQGLIKIGVGLVVNKIATALSGKKNQGKPAFGVSGQMQRGADLPQSFIFGRYATAGSLTWGEEWGTAGNTPNAYLTTVVELSNLPVRGLVEIWINGEKVTIDRNNPHAQYGWPLKQVIGSQDENPKNYDGYAWVKFYDGTQTTADPWLSSEFTEGEFAIDDNFIGTGNAYAIMTVKVKQEGLWNGFPSYMFVLDGIEFLDPLTGVTASDHTNPVNFIYTLMRGLSFGGDWFYGSQKIQQPQLPAQAWKDQATKCDNAGFSIGGEVFVDVEGIDVISETLSSCNGKMAESGGRFKILAVEPDAPVFVFNDDQIVTTEQQSFTPFVGLSDAVNGISIVYPSPSEGWQNTTAPPLYRDDLEAEDDNRRMISDVELPFVTDDEQVQRLMTTALKEARRARKHSMTLPPEAWLLEPLDCVQWNSTRNQYSSKQFTLDGLVDKVDGDVVIDMTETDPSDYTWNSSTDFTPIAHPIPIYPVVADQPMSGLTVIPTSLATDGGQTRLAAISVGWQTGLDDINAVRVQIRKQSTQSVIFDQNISGYEIGGITVSQNIVGLTQYQVRAKFVPFTQRNTTWSSWISVTTPNVVVNLSDLGEDVINHIATVVEEQANETAQDFANQIVEVNSSIDVVKTEAGELAAESRDRLEEFAEDAISSLLKLTDAETRMYDAGIRVNENTGEVFIEGIAVLDGQMINVEQRMAAAEGLISLKATMTQVNLAIANAQLNPTELAALGDIEAQINAVELTIDALQASLLLKASAAALTSTQQQLTTAQTQISALEGQISDLVTNVEFTDIKNTLTSVQQTLNALDIASITRSIYQVQTQEDLTERLAEQSIEGLLDNYDDGVEQNERVALVKEELSADIDEQGNAIATLRQELATEVGETKSLIIQEASTRASGDSSNASLITTLQSTQSGHTTTLQQQAETIAGLGGTIRYLIDNNGHIAGWSLTNQLDGNQTPWAAFSFLADQFQISSVDGQVSPFVVYTTPTTINGTVVPPGVYLSDVFIRDGVFDSAKIADVIQSSNFVENVSGWRIKKSGQAEFNDIVFSRDQVIDSGYLNIGSTPGGGSTLGVVGTWYAETNTASGAWNLNPSSYYVSVGRRPEVGGADYGTIYANTGVGVTNIQWGWSGEVVPITRWSGPQRLWIKINKHARNVHYGRNFQVEWKLKRIT